MSAEHSYADVSRASARRVCADGPVFIVGTCLEMAGMGVLIVGWAPVVGGHGPAHWGHQIAPAILALIATLASLVLYEHHPRLRYWTRQLPQGMGRLLARVGLRARRPEGQASAHDAPVPSGWWCWLTPWLAPVASGVAVGRLLAIDHPADARGWACFAFLIACLAAGSQRRRWLLVQSSLVWSSVSLPVMTWLQSLLVGSALHILIGSVAPTLAVPVGGTTRFLLAMIAMQVIFIPLEVLLLPARGATRDFLRSLFAGHDAPWFWGGTFLVGVVGASAVLWALPTGLHWLGALAALVGVLLLRTLWLRPACA